MTPTDKPDETRIAGILQAFAVDDGIYKRQAVEAAIAVRDEIIPELIKILEEVRARPLDYINTGSLAHIYAFILLGHFKAAEAHPVIVDLFSQPEAVIDPLYGDLITEDLSTVLYRTCHGSFDLIEALVANKAAYEYCRSAAADVLTFGVAMGQLSRDKVLEFFGSLFTHAESEPDSDFLSSLAVSVYDLYPQELMVVIKQGYDTGLISPMMIGYKEFEQAVAQGSLEQSLEKIRRDMQRKNLDDVHSYMSWWAMFDAKESALPRSLSPLMPAPRQTPAKQKDKKKKKRKMAQASKKKNRR